MKNRLLVVGEKPEIQMQPYSGLGPGFWFFDWAHLMNDFFELEKNAIGWNAKNETAMYDIEMGYYEVSGNAGMAYKKDIIKNLYKISAVLKDGKLHMKTHYYKDKYGKTNLNWEQDWKNFLDNFWENINKENLISVWLCKEGYGYWPEKFDESCDVNIE